MYGILTTKPNSQLPISDVKMKFNLTQYNIYEDALLRNSFLTEGKEDGLDSSKQYFKLPGAGDQGLEDLRDKVRQ